MNGLGYSGAEGVREEGAEPFREGADVRTKEGVNGVSKDVVGVESAIRNSHKSQPRSHRIHHVRTWAWHDYPV